VRLSRSNEATGWQRLIGSPELQIIFHKRATKYTSLLRKMTHKDKGSYESSPPCNQHLSCHVLPRLISPSSCQVRYLNITTAPIQDFVSNIIRQNSSLGNPQGTLSLGVRNAHTYIHIYVHVQAHHHVCICIYTHTHTHLLRQPYTPHPAGHARKPSNSTVDPNRRVRTEDESFWATTETHHGRPTIYIYIYIYTYMHIYIFIYVYM